MALPIFRSEAKATIGCRVDESLKDEMVQKAYDEGYSSFSQFLEELIVKAFNNDDSQIDSLLERIIEEILPEAQQTNAKNYNTSFFTKVDAYQCLIKFIGIMIDQNNPTLRRVVMERLKSNYENDYKDESF